MFYSNREGLPQGAKFFTMIHLGTQSHVNHHEHRQHKHCGAFIQYVGRNDITHKRIVFVYPSIIQPPEWCLQAEPSKKVDQTEHRTETANIDKDELHEEHFAIILSNLQQAVLSSASTADLLVNLLPHRLDPPIICHGIDSFNHI